LSAKEKKEDDDDEGGGGGRRGRDANDYVAGVGVFDGSSPSG
jgi:hypothetical protein